MKETFIAFMVAICFIGIAFLAAALIVSALVKRLERFDDALEKALEEEGDNGIETLI